MALARFGIVTFEDLEAVGAERLTEIVGSRRRAEALLEAIGQEISITPNRYSSVHERLAARLGVEQVVRDCGASMDTEYEDAVMRLLKQEESWEVSVRDDGRRMNEPGIFLRLNDVAVLLEIKTASRRSGLIKKEAAFAVLQKGADYDGGIFRVTLVRIPVQPDHRFRRKPITDSDSSRSLIPDEPDHRFRSQADHFSAVTGMVQGVWSEGAHGAG